MDGPEDKLEKGFWKCLKRFGEELQTKTPKRLKEDKDDESKEDESTKKSGKKIKMMNQRRMNQQRSLEREESKWQG
ncbi:hypothetical protein Tco_0609699, partial [Tanacetum coccineum]